MSQALTNIIRFGLLGWLCFELLNGMNVLHIQYSYSWYGLMATAICLWILIEAINRRFIKIGHTPLAWPVYLLGFIVVSGNAIGLIFDFNSHFRWYREVSSAFGGMALTAIFIYVFFLLQQAGRIALSTMMLGFFGVFATMFIRSLYVISMYSEAKIFHNNRLASGQLGGFNLDSGLFWTTVGAIVVATVAFRIFRMKTRQAPPRP